MALKKQSAKAPTTTMEAAFATGGDVDSVIVEPVAQSQQAPASSVFLEDMISGPMCSKLSATGQTYREQVTAALVGTGLETAVMTDDNHEALLIYRPCADNIREDGKTTFGIIIIFADACTMNIAENETASHNVMIRLERMAGQHFDGDFIASQSIVLKEIDYAKHAQMAVHVRKILNPANSDVSLAKLTAKGSITINTNRATAIREIEAHSPHAVMARADIGLTVHLNEKSDYNGQYQQGMEPVGRMVAAVIGYTKFEKTTQTNQFTGGQIYKTTVCITDIVTPITDIKFMPFLMAIIYDTWIGYEKWTEPFLRFGTTDRNIGKLIQDPKTGTLSKAHEVKDLQKFNEVRQAFMPATPDLAIELTSGRTTPANYGALVSNPKDFQDVTNAFLADKTINVLPYTPGNFTQVIGFYKANGNQLIDSREVDAMQLATDPKVKSAAILELNSLPGVNPYELIQCQRKLTAPELFEAVYVTTTYNFNNQFIGALSECCAANKLNNTKLDYTSNVRNVHIQDAYNMNQHMFNQSVAQNQFAQPNYVMYNG